VIEELHEHGYEISPGTLYPITKQGRAALADAKGKVRELFGEFFESDP